jgi:16S rRNA (guanine1207-N2)-methyltransferase
MARPHTRLTHRPDHRDDLAAEALLGALPALPEGVRVLVVGDRQGEVEDELQRRGHEVLPWRRFAHGAIPGTAWPDGDLCGAAVVRLPKGKEAFSFALHGTAAMLTAGAPVFVYGANDEGIKPAAKRMQPLFSGIETLDARRHCRVYRGTRPAAPVGLLPALAEHRQVQSLEILGDTFEYVSYPGLFAKGLADPASVALLEAMPELPERAQVLDFASGAGLLSMVMARSAPTASFQLIDADAVAIVAARENVAGALAVCGDSWGRLPSYRRYDRIVSNPPIHTGKGRNYTVLTRLVEGADARLLPGGALWIVVQRQVPVRPMLEASFDDVEVVREDARFRVWRCGRLADRYGL